jgi:molybdopterin converting factor small subunit
MKVKVRTLKGALSEILGESEIIIQIENQARVIDILSLLAEKYGKSFRDYVFNPKTGEINSYLMLALNGVKVDCEKDVDDGSELLILSATGGG